MATGDIKGNIAQLERSLRALKYPAAVDDVGYGTHTHASTASTQTAQSCLLHTHHTAQSCPVD
jgi:hypothetical protein